MRAAAVGPRWARRGSWRRGPLHWELLKPRNDFSEGTVIFQGAHPFSARRPTPRIAHDHKDREQGKTPWRSRPTPHDAGLGGNLVS